MRCSRVFVLGAFSAAGVCAFRLLVDGALTIDVGVGRQRRPLGPIRRQMSAPREVVFDVIAGPYLDKTPRALRDELEVFERSTDMVLAAHHTKVGARMKATTVETVRFERPERVHFRLVRGPVPEVVETFELQADEGERTTLLYRGTLGTDWWALGARWGDAVARKWEDTVRGSLDAIAAEAERRASMTSRQAIPRRS